DSLELFSLAQKEGILISPGTIFSIQPGHRHCFRLSFTRPLDAEMRAAIRQLGLMVRNMSKE
ncbi:MAG: PLP-dependent aminotransferase family protein, partial [Bacteroidota bacterium]